MGFLWFLPHLLKIAASSIGTGFRNGTRHLQTRCGFKLMSAFWAFPQARTLGGEKASSRGLQITVKHGEKKHR